MKKLIFALSIVAIFATVLLTQPAKTQNGTGDLSLKNAEALALSDIVIVGCWNAGGCRLGGTVYDYALQTIITK